MYFVRPPYLLNKAYKKAIWRIPTNKREVYLTFDDGPVPEITPWVLSTLKEYNATATFFCVGENVLRYPEIYRQIISEKHSVGNHTFNHLNGWKTRTAIYLDNIQKCSELVSSNLFRPPYGKLKRSQYSSLLSNQYSIIMWDVLSGDFDKNTSPEKCLRNILESTREGSIIVLHDSIKSKKNLLYVLPKILAFFSNKGISLKGL